MRSMESSDMTWPKIEIDSDSELKRVSKLNWNSDMTLKLIEVFEKECRVLWDVKDPSYKDRNVRQAKQEYLANMFGTTVEEISRKLHNMRSQFNNEMRKLKKKQLREGSLLGASSWDYFDALLFLVREPSGDPLDISMPLEAVNIELAEFQAEEEMEFGYRVQQSLANSSPTRQRKPPIRVAASAPPPLPPSAHPMMWPEEPLPKIRPGLTADECQIFGDFVASELRTLRSDESRKRLKRVIQKAILKIGEEEDVNIITG